MSAALENAKKLAGRSDDSLARAALAVQNSDIGSARKIESLTAYLNGQKQLSISPISVSMVKAIVMQETEMVIANDDPLLLMLLATQNPSIDKLIDAVNNFKKKYDLRNTLDGDIPPQPEFSNSWFNWLVAGCIFGLMVGVLIGWMIWSN